MNRENRNGERYSHCLCLHVKPASLFIGIYFFITSVLNLIKLSSGYNIRNEEDMRRFVAVNRPTTTLLLMINLMVSVVSAMLIYGVTKSKASYLMPFFGIQLYHFLFSLPSSLSQLNISTSQYRHHYGNSPVTSPTEVRNILRTEGDNTTYTFSILLTLIDFLCDIYFICVVWKCYRYLKIKEIASTLNLPYNLDLEIVIPSDVVSSTTVAPPDYETAIKANPPPDYESAIKFQSQNQVIEAGGTTGGGDGLNGCGTTLPCANHASDSQKYSNANNNSRGPSNQSQSPSNAAAAVDSPSSSDSGLGRDLDRSNVSQSNQGPPPPDYQDILVDQDSHRIVMDGRNGGTEVERR